MRALGLKARFSPRSGNPAQVIYSGAGVAVPQTFLGTTFNAPVIYLGADAPGRWDVIVSTVTSRLTTQVGHSAPVILRAETVRVSSTGTVPAPLVANTDYYPVNPVSTGFQVSATPGGAPITLTNQGTGTVSVLFYCTDRGSPAIVSRSLDSGTPNWKAINTADGVYDWTRMDAALDYHYKQRGRQTLYCFTGTPSWAARNQALDAYGQAGGGQAPTDPTKAATFVTALMQRYNAVSAFNPTGARMIYAIESWNEPSHAATGTINENYCGTMAELANHTRLINQAAKAVDPGVLILGPGYTVGHAYTWPSLTNISLYNFLKASDGVAGTGKDWIDGVCYHGYDSSDTTLFSHSAKIQNLRGIVQAAGLAADFPLYQTERGIDVGNHELLHIRYAAVEAALGVKLTIAYTHDDYGLNPRVYPALLAAITDFYNKVCGKTITYCAIEMNGSVTVTADGVTSNW